MRYYLLESDTGYVIKRKRLKGQSSKGSNTVKEVGSLEEAQAFFDLKDKGIAVI